MNQQKTTKTWAWVTALLFLLALPLYAADPEHREHMSKEKMSKHQMTSGLAKLCTAKDLIGCDVNGKVSMPMSSELPAAAEEKIEESDRPREMKTGEKIGTVKELVLDDNRDKVHYVIVAAGDKFHPVPWWAFDVTTAGAEKTSSVPIVPPQSTVGTGQLPETPPVPASGRAPEKLSLCLNLTKDLLGQAPSIESVSQDNIRDEQLIKDVHAFYAQHIGKAKHYGKVKSISEGADQPGLARERKGELSSEPGARVGEESSPRRAYGARADIVPADLYLASDFLGLKIHGADDADLGKLDNLLVERHRGNIVYGLVSFGGIIGLGEKTSVVPWSSLTVIPDEGFARLDATKENLESTIIEKDNLEKLSEPEFARRIHDTYGTEPYWEVFGYVRGEERVLSSAAWSPGSTYNRNFDPGQMTSFEGAIKNVGSFYPVRDSTPGTRLDVTDKDGKSFIVYAGPREFATEKNFSFKSGSDIYVTGCKATIDGKAVIMASELRIGEKTLILRDNLGTPQWKTELPTEP